MDWWFVFAVLLFFASAALILAEVFVPSGGIISFFSLICLIGGVIIFFRHSTFAGVAGVIIALIMIPSVLIIAYRIFPKTKFGKTVTLTPPLRQQGDAIPDTEELKSLIGKIGVVLSPLRPVGMCDFSGRRIECVAETGYIEKGKEIRVIRVQGTQLTVRMNEET